MENLAGRKDCDVSIERELATSGIAIVRHPEPSGGEVNATISGVLGRFIFTRAWCYWVVSGPLPLAIAQEIYADWHGVREVRAGGDCACRPPETCMRWALPDGREVVPASNEPEFDKFIARGIFKKEVKDGYVFSDVPSSIGAVATVNTYHIDTADGLNLFTRILRKHGLA